MIIIGIFFLAVSEYILPKSVLSITPKAQGEKRKKSEKYSIYFPSKTRLKLPPLKAAFKKKSLFKYSIEGLLLILVPILFGLVWVVLSSYEIVPSLYDTIF